MTKIELGRRQFCAGILGGGAALLAGIAPAGAQTTSDAQQLIDQARATVQQMRTDREFGNAAQLLRRARAVMIVPQLVKGGFFVGGEGGGGVLLQRTSQGWSAPAFYTLAAASFGLQIGLETARVVMFVMSEKALQAWLQDSFTFGGQASLAVVTVGSNVAAGSTTALTGDVIVWAKAEGAFAGLTLEGAVIKQRHEYDQAYYGSSATATGQIFATRPPRGTYGLRTAL